MSNTKNTRVAVPLTEEAYDAISLISQVTGVSRGRILADAFEAAAPSFIAVAAAYRAAMAVEGEERQAIIDAMHQAENKLLGALSDLDLPRLSQGEESCASARRPEGQERADAQRPDPPVTNRGVPNSSKGGH